MPVRECTSGKALKESPFLIYLSPVGSPGGGKLYLSFYGMKKVGK